MSVVGITTKGNAEQAELMRLIMDNQHPIVICEGAAGTGKNFISIASALELVLKRRYEKIYYSLLTNKRYNENELIKLQEKYGGRILCILNAETIRNTYTIKRQELKAKLNELNAEINETLIVEYYNR